jgi:hypothetical protein
MEKAVDVHFSSGFKFPVAFSNGGWTDFFPVWSDIYLETLKGNRIQDYDAEPDSHMSLPSLRSLYSAWVSSSKRAFLP